MSKYGWEGIRRVKARVKIRPQHNGNLPKPAALALDGKVFDFDFQWVMDEDDPYPGEIAWAPANLREYTENYPDAPTWIASGDLEIIAD